MTDLTSSKSKIFHSESLTLEKSQELALHVNTVGAFPLCKSIQLKTYTELWIFIFLAFNWPHALNFTALNFILDAKAAKETQCSDLLITQTEARSGQENISEQVPDWGQQEEGVNTQV